MRVTAVQYTCSCRYFHVLSLHAADGSTGDAQTFAFLES